MIQIYTSVKSICQNVLLPVLVLLFFIKSNAQIKLTFAPVINSTTVPPAGVLTNPIDIVNAGDGSNRLFVVQQNGVIKVFDQSYTYLADFVTVTGISTGGERGLLSMAFHPDYINNGYFFVYYTNTAGAIEVARYRTLSPSTSNVADPTSKSVLITIPHPGQSNHNGGKLNFGADGNLYFATGDGGGGDDIPNNAQNGASLLGKMLRLNVGTTEPNATYTIPSDNPFIAGADGIMDEIWSLGLRNPFRWSFDRQTHDMWIGDVGQGAWEEVDFTADGTPGGLNYGWHCLEGKQVNPNPAISCTITTGVYAPPLLDYTHNNATGGFAIIGGYVYRGTLNPAMYEHYIFADEVSSNVWLLPHNGTAADTIEFAGALAQISSFGEAENGELYVTTLNGAVYNVQAALIALPVKLISFTGNAGTGVNDLNWTTSNEIQFRQYEIEYSNDGISFQQAGIVSATNSPAYHFRHIINTSGKLYYRLKMVDNDGKFEYSKIIILSAVNNTNKNFVTPSLVTNGTIAVELADAYTSLQIMDMNGKAVYNESINNRTGKINVHIPQLRAGQYLVRLSGNGKQLTQKIMVQ